MDSKYVITEQELMEKGINLNEYALDGTYIPAIINMALDIAVSRICFLNDEFSSELDIENGLNAYNSKISAFKKLQHRIIFNLIFQAEESPIDLYVDSVITHELRWGKINGFQKGLYYKNN